jgi:hypothetical protein
MPMFPENAPSAPFVFFVPTHTTTTVSEKPGKKCAIGQLMVFQS